MPDNVLYSTDTNKVLAFSPVFGPTSATPFAPVPLVNAVSATTRWQVRTAAEGTGVAGTGNATFSGDVVNYKPGTADLALPPAIYLVQLTIKMIDGSDAVPEPGVVDLRAAI